VQHLQGITARLTVQCSSQSYEQEKPYPADPRSVEIRNDDLLLIGQKSGLRWWLIAVK
jgi:hypothetical protein